jgi:hypothetical protein
MTLAYLGLAAFDLVATALGYAVLNCLGFVRRPAEAVRYVGLAFFAGWALEGILLSLLLLVGIDPSVWHTAVLAAVLAGACVWARRYFPRLERPFRAPDRDLLLRTAAIAGGALLVVALAAGIVSTVRLGADPRWDVWAVWLPKAKAIYYFHGLATGIGGFTTYGNPFYPPLVPALTAQTFHLMGGVHTTVLPLQQSLIGAMWVVAVVALLGPRVQRWLLLPLLAVLVLAPDFWSRLSTVLPDQTVGYLLALGAVACVLWLDERRRAYLVLATVFLGAATLTKEEGFFLSALLAAVIIGAAFVSGPRRPALPTLWLALGPALIEPWRLWLSAHHLPPSATQYSWTSLLHPHYLSAKYWRFEYALPKMVDFVFARSDWSLVPPLVIAGLVVAAWRVRALTAALAVWLVAGFFGLAVVYWIGTYNVYWYVGYSAHRVVATLPLVAGTLLPLLLALAVERSGRRPGGTTRPTGLVGESDLRQEQPALTGAD